MFPKSFSACCISIFAARSRSYLPQNMVQRQKLDCSLSTTRAPATIHPQKLGAKIRRDGPIIPIPRHFLLSGLSIGSLILSLPLFSAQLTACYLMAWLSNKTRATYNTFACYHSADILRPFLAAISRIARRSPCSSRGSWACCRRASSTHSVHRPYSYFLP